MSDKTNNDRLMQKTGLMIVYAWVMLAVGFFVLTAWDPTYLASSEDYVSILAIIGGPALLIVTKVIETWSQEKQMELQDYEPQAAHERAMQEYNIRHSADMERYPHREPGPTERMVHGKRIEDAERLTRLEEEINQLRQSLKE